MKNKTMYNHSPQPHCRTLEDFSSNLPLFQILYPEQKLQNKTNRIGFKVAAFLAPYMKSSDTHTKESCNRSFFKDTELFYECVFILVLELFLFVIVLLRCILLYHIELENHI